MNFFFRALILIFSVATSNAQNIIGKVVDAKTAAPLSFANVFLNNTTLGTVSDAHGDFQLKNIQPGSYELVVSFVGYESRKVKVIVRQADLVMSAIAVTPSKIELNTVEVKGTRDKAWERQLKKFSTIFIGKNELADSCEIINPWVIDFPKDTTGSRFIATADDPIEILNKALGYKVFYYLTDFWSRGEEYVIKGNVRFEEREPVNEKQKERLKRNREIAFRKSYNYFFHSLFTGHVEKSGFKIYYRDINKNNKNFGLEYWKPFDTAGIIYPTARIGEYRIAMKGQFRIQNLKAKSNSLVEVTGKDVKINGQGFVLNPADLVVYGTYSENRLASLLPISYHYKNEDDAPNDPEQLDISQFDERVYVHTDKPHYYPGESMWIKGYVFYANSAWRDSLSRTAYIEFINPEKKVVQSKVVEIDSGFFHNDFVLPDTLREATYYLRAYTNLNRNFGDSTLFVKPVPVVDKTNKVDQEPQAITSTSEDQLVISSEKLTYRPREKIVLNLTTKDVDGESMAANLSISVNDVLQVPLADKLTIKEGLIPRQTNVNVTQLQYAIEYGIGIKGRFLNDDNEPEKAKLNIVQIKPQSLMQVETDEKGIFYLSDLTIYDTATFAFKVVKEKRDVSYGKIEIAKREVPLMLFKESKFPVATIKTELPPRILSNIESGYEVSKDTRLLKEVVVKGQRIDQVLPYGLNTKSERIIKGEDLNKTNILYTLRNTPGVDVDLISGVIRSTRMGIVTGQQMTQKGWGGGPPFSLSIDGLFIYGPDPSHVGQRLGALKTADIAYITVTRMPTYSHIAVRMKRPEEIVVTPNFQKIKIQGYSSPRNFRFRDYNDPKTDTTKADYRSTIYWNPNVVTNEKTGTATVSFFAADLPGKYRIVAEGVTQNGEPVRCVYFVEVDSD